MLLRWNRFPLHSLDCVRRFTLFGRQTLVVLRQLTMLLHQGFMLAGHSVAPHLLEERYSSLELPF